MVSIIIRTKNEEKWITSCLRSVFSQTFKDFEVIIVDNNSTDKTVEKANAFNVKIVRIADFLPGKAINFGIKHSTGNIIVCLSAHCIPVNNYWLENLLKNFIDNNVAGIYGRQEPMSFTNDSDKRDLLIVFGIDKKVQKKDPFFHNANSAFRREIWEKIPFSDKVTNIEDRVWGKEVITKGYYIIYEPDASVYHYHGIHQDGDPIRCRNVVSILESLESNGNKEANLDINKLNIVALIPIKGDVQYCGNKPLIEYTINSALESKYVNKVIVSTDNFALAEISKKLGAETPFLRPEELSMEYIDINMVLQYSLNQMEEKNILPDLIVVLEATYPFRHKGLIDELIKKLIKGGFDSIVPVKPEYRAVWIKEDSDTKILGQGFMPRKFKKSSIFISLLGLGFVTHPNFVREGRMLGDKIGISEIENLYSYIEVRDKESIKFAGDIIANWDKK